MADDPQKRLEQHAENPVPPINPDFANRLESKLRVEHAAVTTRRPWVARSMAPRVLAAAALVVAGVAGIVAVTADDAGVPVAVVDDEQVAPLDAPATDGDVPVDVTPSSTPTLEQTPGSDERPAVPPATPTATPPVPTPAAPPVVGATPAAPTSTPLPTQSTPPIPASPTAQVATAVPLPATTVPVPTATAVPDPTPTPTPQTRPTLQPVPTPTRTPPTVTPTPEREPASIEMACETRTAADAVGVVCTWDAPTTDRTVARYEVMRSRNSGEALVVARQRASAPTSYIDRDVASGDAVIYLVRALDADDRVVGASIREMVRIP